MKAAALVKNRTIITVAWILGLAAVALSHSGAAPLSEWLETLSYFGEGLLAFAGIKGMTKNAS